MGLSQSKGEYSVKDFSNLSLGKFVSALQPQTCYAQKAVQERGKK
jgi:hypothetical protein